MRYFLIFTFFISGISQLFAQNSLNYRVSYYLTYRPDTTAITSTESEIMWLFANKNSSLFLSRGVALKDSIAKNTDKSMIGTESWKRKLKSTKTEFNFRIFKNKIDNKAGYGIKLISDKLYYTEPLDQMEWDIEQETKEIAGYQTQKAKTSFAGRDYIAWFTPEIPISDGPYKFAGLPGLILELQDTKGDYIFSFAGFEELSEPLDYQIIIKNYKETKKEELLDLLATYERDPISYVNNYLGDGGKTIRIGLEGDAKKSYLKKYRAELAKKNNPIELQE